MILQRRVIGQISREYRDVNYDRYERVIRLVLPSSYYTGNLTSPCSRYRSIISVLNTITNPDSHHVDFTLTASPKLSDGGTLEDCARFFEDAEEILGLKNE